jgi:hypothetical protein
MDQANTKANRIKTNQRNSGIRKAENGSFFVISIGTQIKRIILIENFFSFS